MTGKYFSIILVFVFIGFSAFVLNIEKLSFSKIFFDYFLGEDNQTEDNSIINNKILAKKIVAEDNNFDEANLAGEILDEKEDINNKEKEIDKIDVANVIDGDTIELTTGEKIRYIGVDSPELNKSGSADDECLAWAARIRNSELLKNGELKLVKDPSADKDKYGRLLRYVYVNNIFVNEELARAGLARDFFCEANWENCPLTSDKNRREIILGAVEEARKNRRGIFGASCEKILLNSTAGEEKKIIFPAHSSNESNDVFIYNYPELSRQVVIVAPVSQGGGGYATPGAGNNIQKEDKKEAKIASFYVYDQITKNKEYTSSTTVGVDIGIEGDASIDGYYLSVSTTTPASDDIFWQSKLPEIFILDLEDGLKSVNLWIKYSGIISSSTIASIYLDTKKPILNLSENPDYFSKSTTSTFKIDSDEDNINLRFKFDDNEWQIIATSTAFSNDSPFSEGEHILSVEATDPANNIGTTSYAWITDLTAPTSTINLLETEYGATGFIVSWSGSDLSAATTSGVKNFDLEYKINDGDWQNWLIETASTSEIFNFAVNPGDQIYFRARGRDKAGNLGEWSGLVETKISLPIAPPVPPALPTTNHIVISEIQISGEMGSDEFVELYNPTNAAINLENYRLSRKTASGKTGNNLLTNFPNINLSPHSYYLIAHPTGYDGEVAADIFYSTGSAIVDDNTVILYDAAHAVVDKIGFGLITDTNGVEGMASINPGAGQSLERKAIASSTDKSMASGGTDEFLGNGCDTDNNSVDFILRLISEPQNSSNTKEPE
ncbi:MAG: lamin tail domain-containing protein [Patescibacteria group bacterium]|nr:lamin tail domain-containing protein [Patescibacteria group bacterium]MDD4611201.1 lamin tail domain-containing protein [Patescibacteria group bacterium]